MTIFYGFSQSKFCRILRFPQFWFLLLNYEPIEKSMALDEKGYEVKERKTGAISKIIKQL